MHIKSNYKQLQPEERVTLASLRQQDFTTAAMAKVLGRAPSTITLEFKRNTCQNQYASQSADQRCKQRRMDGRPTDKLHADAVLFGVVRHFLSWHWSPQQIALLLAASYPKCHKDRLSTETIYTCIYAQPVGELRRELIACLRHARLKRAPHSKGQDKRGEIPNMVSIHLSPPEIKDRQLPWALGRRLDQRQGQRQCSGYLGWAHQSRGRAGQAPASQACERVECLASLYGQAAWHSRTHAQEHDVWPRQRDVDARQVDREHGCGGLLL